MARSTYRYCAACGAIAEGRYSIERDGPLMGPEVPLCDRCGAHDEPTMEQLWHAIARRRLASALKEARRLRAKLRTRGLVVP